jgi:uncharacterized membrane protein HdeD (DUF308 family)
MLANILSRWWWMLLLRGVLWIAFGIIVLTQPGASLATFLLLFGAFVLVDGVANVVNGIGGRRENENWWLLLLAGLAGIGVGVLTLMNPGITTLALQFYIAIWAVAIGLLKIVGAIRLRKEIQGEIWFGLSGLLSVAFGIMLVAQPAAGALALLTVIGVFAVAFGVALVVLAFAARGFAKRAVDAGSAGARA